MRRGGGLWMITFKDREPATYDELPVYFRTRRSAQDWADWLEAHRNTDAWGWREDDALVVRPAPAEVTADDIEWDSYA